MKFYGGVRDGKRNKWLKFGGELDQHADCPITNPAIAQKAVNRLLWHFMKGSGMINETRD